jgi:hypothetical protein
MRAKRIFTAQGIAYRYLDRDGFSRRLWVISENSPDELYQELERIRRLANDCERPLPLHPMRQA